MKFFNTSKSGYNYDNYLDADVETTSRGAAQAEAVAPQPTKPAASGLNLGGSSIELKVVRPERFEEVSEVADHLLSGRTVVLNLEFTNKEVTRRLIDFLSGVAYSIDGQIKRVANNTYIITPTNVEVSESEAEAEQPAAQPLDLDYIPDFEG